MIMSGLIFFAIRKSLQIIITNIEGAEIKIIPKLNIIIF